MNPYKFIVGLTLFILCMILITAIINLILTFEWKRLMKDFDMKETEQKKKRPKFKLKEE